MGKRLFLLWLAAFALGAVWHFFYDWLPVPLVGLVAPVNESVWEHLKLLFWPYLIVQAAACKGSGAGERLGGVLLSLLVMPLWLLGSYYLLQAGFGVARLWVDIALYGLTLLGGFLLAAHSAPGAARWKGVLAGAAALYGVSLLLFTFATPEFPLFMAPM